MPLSLSSSTQEDGEKPDRRVVLPFDLVPAGTQDAGRLGDMRGSVQSAIAADAFFTPSTSSRLCGRQWTLSFLANDALNEPLACRSLVLNVDDHASLTDAAEGVTRAHHL